MARWRGNIEKHGKDLIRQITGFQDKDENFQLCQQFMNSNFKFHRFLDVNSHNVTRELEGVITKFHVHSQPDKARILTELLDEFLENPISKDIQDPKTSTHYAVLCLLLSLAENPTSIEYTEIHHSVVEELDDTFDWSAHLLEGEEVLWSRYSDSPLPFEPELSDDEDYEENSLKQKTVTFSANEGNLTVVAANITTATEDQQNKGFDWLSKNIVQQYWLGKTEEPTTGPYSSSNLYRDWDYYKNQTDLFYSSGKKTFVTETHIIREVLWMLAGVEDLYIFQYSKHKFSLRKNVCVSHLTVPSLDSLLQPFMKHGSHIAALSSFVRETVAQSCMQDGLCSVPVTYQAFANSVSSVLTDFCQHLACCEKKMVKQEELMTLNLLYRDLEDWLEKVDLVYSIYINGLAAGASLPTNSLKVSHLLSVIYNTIIDFDTLQNSTSDLLSMLLPLWLQTIRPYLDLIGNWITNGRLSDPTKEFIVQRNENVKTFDENFWENAFILQLPRSANNSSNVSTTLAQEEQVAVATAWAPRFLQPVMKAIVLTGKSMEVLESLGLLTEVVGRKDDFLYQASSLYDTFLTSLNESLGTSKPSPTTREITPHATIFLTQIEKQMKVKGVHDPLLLKNFEAVFSSLYVSPSLENKDNAETRLVQDLVERIQPMDVLLKRCLYPHIRSRYENVCLKFVEILKTEYHLMEYLAAMRHFFLMDAGDTMFSFYTELFNKIKMRESWHETYYLNMALHEALEAHHPNEVSRLTIEVNDTSERVDKFPISATDCIKLSYKVPWPVSVVINKQSMEIYNQVFSFIMQVKRTKYCLDELRFIDLGREKLFESEKQTNEGSEDLPRVVKIHKMQVLRFRLMYFVNSLHNYMMTRILHSTELEFKRDLDKAVDLDQIISAHTKYVTNIHQRCLLHQSVALLREAFMRVLNIVLTFQIRWDLGVDEIRSQAIEEMETEFSNCITFLASFLHSVIKRGSFPHLESLSFALMTSLEYKRKT